MHNIHAFGIDLQRDFCDPDGALFVPGADQDSVRTAQMIRRLGRKVSQINMTLDSHNVFDIAHPSFWKDSNGNNPAPYATISADDVKSGAWTPVRPELRSYVTDYLSALNANGRYPHTIWPPHCLMGTEGFALHADVADAIHEWAEMSRRTINFVSKGSNYKTEHFSAVRAEVPDPTDPSTQVNTSLIQTLESADEIVLFGQASSHCVSNTVRDIASAFSNPDYVKKIVCLTDAMSPVTGFESFADDFLRDLTAMGMRTSTTADYLR